MQKSNIKFKSDIRDRCYKLGLEVIKLCDTLPQKRSAWVISDQVIRSSTSICANLVEAKASSSRLEFKKFYEISLKSTHETIYWLTLLADSKIASKNKITPLVNEATEISNMLGAGVLKLKRKNL